MGINTFVASWVPPDHNIIGMIVPRRGVHHHRLTV
jgi:hypothetical protein